MKMRKIILIFTFYLLAVVSFGQSHGKLKSVTVKTGFKPKTIEKYYIDKKSNARFGEYKKFSGETILLTGYYNNNLKDSIWSEYSIYGNIIAQGEYSKDKKVENWYYFSFKGDTIQIYDHTKATMILYDTIKEKKLYPKNMLPGNSDTIVDNSAFTKTDKKPIYIGGKTKIRDIIMKNIHYPAIDRSNGIQGVSYVLFVVDREGNTVNVSIKNSISETIDEESKRVISLLGKNWVPGVHEGKKVNCYYIIPLMYKLN